MIEVIGNVKIDIDSLKGITKTSFVNKFRLIVKNPEEVYETLKDKIKETRKKK